MALKYPADVDKVHIALEIKTLAEKHAALLRSSTETRLREMSGDDRSHYLIYDIFGVTPSEGELIDVYQNKGRLLYRRAGSFLEAAARLCFLEKYPDSRSIRVPNIPGRRPHKFEVDCLVGRDAHEFKWRDATTDGDHVLKEHARIRAIAEAGYRPVRVMFYNPNRSLAVHIQRDTAVIYRDNGGEYYSGAAAWKYVEQSTGVDLLSILQQISVEGSRPKVISFSRPPGIMSMTQFRVKLQGKTYTIERHLDGTFELPAELRHMKGLGSALKPSWEPILVFRKPLKGTLAANVLKHGTGGLNIDASRVRHASAADFEAHKKGIDSIREKGGSRDKSWKNSSDLSGANEVNDGGRWPSNILLEHSDRCVKVGSKEVKTPPGGSRRLEALGRMNDDGWRPEETPCQRYARSDGLESVEAWECIDEVLQSTWASMPDGTNFCLEQASPEIWLGVLMLLQTHLDSHSGGTESTRSSAPAREPSCSGPPGFQDDCPACSRFCDELLLQIEDAGRDSPRRLAGALEHVLVLVRSRLCNLPCQHGGLLSSSDGSPAAHAGPYIRLSSTSSLSVGDEREPCTQGTEHTASLPAAKRDNNPLCNTERACGDELGTPSRSGDIGAQLLRVLVSSMNAAAAYTPLSLRVVERKSICPVLALDQQSGDRPSTLTGRADPASSHEHPGTEMNPTSTFLGERRHLSKVYADAGGASRFFTQLEADEPNKGSPSKIVWLHATGCERVGSETNEEWRCVEDCPVKEGGASRFFTQLEAEGGAPFKYIPKANRKEAGCGEFEVQHVTVKPLSLLRWLVKLVTQKGGTVLDMYAGSGTTLHAAVLEGMHFIGMERDPVNHAEALRRLEIVFRKEQEKKDAEELFEFSMGRG